MEALRYMGINKTKCIKIIKIIGETILVFFLTLILGIIVIGFLWLISNK